MEKLRDLPYGENPHQQAAFYRETTHRTRSLADAVQLQGPQPTFNDLLDLDAAYRIVTDFAAPTCAIVKQGNPVGLASNDSAGRGVPEGARGRPGQRVRGGRRGQPPMVDVDTAEAIAANAYEAVVAPGYTDARPDVLATKEKLAVLAVPRRRSRACRDYGIADLDFHRIDGGLLVETLDRSSSTTSQLQVVTKRRPTLEELTDLLFAWRAVRHVSQQRGRARPQRVAGRASAPARRSRLVGGGDRAPSRGRPAPR